MRITIFLFSLLLSTAQRTFAQDDPDSHYNQQCDTVFNNFIAAVRTIAQRHQSDHSSVDTADIRLLFSNHFIYFDVNGEIPVEQHYDIIVRNIQAFTAHFEQDTSKLFMRHLDPQKDKMIFDSFDEFTRAQSFAVTRSGSTDVPLFYLLILNGPLLRQTTPKVISWKVVYVSGRFLFENVLNQPGTYQFFNIHNH